MNYCRLMKLMPAAQETAHTFSIPLMHHQSTKVNTVITEQCRYTTMLTLSLLQGIKWLECRFELRLYHDVKMAEVIAFQGQRHVWPMTNHLKRHLYQPDEKHQQQQFLAHILNYCHENGVSDWVV